MSTLRDAPGYAEMEDYYDSDYVPTQLVRRYEELLQERRRRTELQFIAATQAHGMHTAQDTNFDKTVDSVASPLSPFQQRQPSSEQRNSAYVVLSPSHRGTGLATTHPANHRASSAPRHGPRASVALDAIYAARAIDHSSSGNTSGVLTAPSTTVQRAHTATSSSSSPGLLGTVDASTSTHTTASRRATSKTNKKKKRKLVVSPAEEPHVRDLYDSAAEAERQERFFSESRRLGKPFVPTGGGGLDLPTRFMLGDCVKMLYRSIVPDWRVASPMVVSTAEDLVAVYFSMEKLEKPQVTALLQYMNAALLHNTAIREFHLTKVPEGWDVLTDDGYVLYTFRPPWVKKRVFLPDTVNPSHAHLREGED